MVHRLLRLLFLLFVVLALVAAQDEERDDEERDDDDDGDDEEGGDDEEDRYPPPQAWEGVCPSGCECVQNERYCKVRIQCGAFTTALPDASQWPAEADCIGLQPRTPEALSGLTLEQKSALLKPLPRTIRQLDLSMCRLGALPADFLQGFPSLKMLNLEFNNLQTLPPPLFHGLPKLKVLWLTGQHYRRSEEDWAAHEAAKNELTALHPAQFEGLGSLQVLLLHHNLLAALPTPLFNGTPQLRVLKLVDNRLPHSLSPAAAVFAPLTKVEQLDLNEDSGDALEDSWERDGTYLDDPLDATGGGTAEL